MFSWFENNESLTFRIYQSLRVIFTDGVQYQALPLSSRLPAPNAYFLITISCGHHVFVGLFVCRSSSPNHAIHYRRFFSLYTCNMPLARSSYVRGRLGILFVVIFVILILFHHKTKKKLHFPPCSATISQIYYRNLSLVKMRSRFKPSISQNK